MTMITTNNLSLPAPPSAMNTRWIPGHLQRRSDARRNSPVLRFSPPAWAKLHYFRDRGPTEIGGFGVTAVDDPLLIEEFITVRQITTCVSVAFDDAAVADFFETQVDAGRKPEQFGRVWLHTHPGESPSPSGVDERTFAQVFGRCTWTLMFILAQGGRTYAQLRFNVGPGGCLLIPTEVDFGRRFAGSDHTAWNEEYEHNIQPAPLERTIRRGLSLGSEIDRLGDSLPVIERPDQIRLTAAEYDPEWDQEFDDVPGFSGSRENEVWP